MASFDVQTSVKIRTCFAGLVNGIKNKGSRVIQKFHLEGSLKIDCLICALLRIPSMSKVMQKDQVDAFMKTNTKVRNSDSSRWGASGHKYCNFGQDCFIIYSKLIPTLRRWTVKLLISS